MASPSRWSDRYLMPQWSRASLWVTRRTRANSTAVCFVMPMAASAARSAGVGSVPMVVIVLVFLMGVMGVCSPRRSSGHLAPVAAIAYGLTQPPRTPCWFRSSDRCRRGRSTRHAQREPRAARHGVRGPEGFRRECQTRAMRLSPQRVGTRLFVKCGLVLPYA